MALLALDLSLNETGYCIDRGIEGVESGIFSPNEKLSQYEKIEYNLATILSMVKKWDIDLVAIESGAFAVNSSSRNILAEQQGVIKHELLKRNVGVAEVSITTIKKFITGKGNANKKLVMQCLRDNHNVFSDNDNECDAIALYLYVMSQDVIVTL